MPPDPYPDLTAHSLADDGEVVRTRQRSKMEAEIAYIYGAGVAGVFPERVVKYCEVRASWGCDRLWYLSATSESTLGGNNANGGAPPPSSTPWGGTAPAGQALTRTSLLSLRVIASGSRGAVIFDMDPTGPPIELVAEHVNAWILAPLNSQEITKETPTPTIVGAVGNTERVTVSIDAIRTSKGAYVTRSTVPIRVDAHAQGQIIVPPYSREVTIYQDNLGGAALEWEQYFGRPGGPGVLAGPIPFMAGLRKSEPAILSPMVTLIASDVDPANARFFSAVFQIKPP